VELAPEPSDHSHFWISREAEFDVCRLWPIAKVFDECLDSPEHRGCRLYAGNRELSGLIDFRGT
jgi:hypothetical protein